MTTIPVLYNFSQPWLIGKHHNAVDTYWDKLYKPLSTSPTQGALFWPSWLKFTNKEESSVSPGNDKQFQVRLDVHHFMPNEIKVTVGDNNITVECKHEEKQDGHGLISRHFIRKYVIPEGHDLKGAVPILSSDGILIITVPHITSNQDTAYNVPIHQTGLPASESNNITLRSKL